MVKEAFERRTHKQVAVKMIRKEKRPRNNSEPDYLMKEMDIPKNLDHPCITKVLEVHGIDKLFVIVMDENCLIRFCIIIKFQKCL